MKPLMIGKRSGFTVVELLIVIVVMGILAGLATIGYRNVQEKAAETDTKADASRIADMIELYFLKHNEFPSTLADLGATNNSSNTVLTYQTTGSAYCLEAGGTKPASKKFTLRDDAGMREGTCTGWTPSSGTIAAAPGKPTVSTSSVTSSAFTANWASVSGATSYSVRYGTSSTPTNVASGCSSNSCTVSGLNANTTYYVTVTATNTTGSTVSDAASTLTKMPAPASASVTYTKSTYKSGVSTYRRYSVTASGGGCSIGSTEWMINVSAFGDSSSSWQVANTKTVDILENGQYSPDDVTIFATPRCISGSNSTQGSTATAISGTGSAGGGAAY